MRIRVAGVSLLCVLLLLIGCTRSAVPMPPLTEPTSVAQAEADMPNPASVFCEEQGGTVDIRSDDEGAQFGVCVFDDGSECEEWAFFRGECTPGTEETGMPNPASVFCEAQGGTVDIRTGDDGGQIGICVFADGSECDEWAFWRGECAPSTEEAGMPNPASVFCEAQGGTVDIRTGDDGGQFGICVFADGSECDEWAFFHGECTPGAAAYLPDIAELEAFEFVDWQSYKNMAYELSLRFPPDWQVTEVTDAADTMAGHRVTLTSPDEPLAALYIAFKRASEDQQITPTGMGGGDLVDRGSVPFLGDKLIRQALIAEGITMGVIYGGGGEIARGEHVFWISLSYAGSPLTDPGLSPEIERLADLIIASVQIAR
jgi:putative hemolysin